jgi:hypothetical protein
MDKSDKTPGHINIGGRDWSRKQITHDPNSANLKESCQNRTPSATAHCVSNAEESRNTGHHFDKSRLIRRPKTRPLVMLAFVPGVCVFGRVGETPKTRE